MARLDRRQLLRTLAAAGALPSLAGPSAAAPARDPDRVRAENDKEGTTDWQLTYTRADRKAKYRSPLIEGYASRASVRAGERIDLFVSTDSPAQFVIDFYRLGYYRGKGGRHVLR